MKKIFIPLVVVIIIAYIAILVISGKKEDDSFVIKTTEATENTTQAEGGLDKATNTDASKNAKTDTSTAGIVINGFEVPEFSEDEYIEINDDVPFFEKSELTTKPFEEYSELDSLGRCGAATACVCVDTMPTEARGEIGSIKPTGWHAVSYEDVIEGGYLFNRCHLIGYALTGENANNKNLITATSFMNAGSILGFEDMVERYISNTGNHVMYRVTPWYKNDNLVATGVQIEAMSVEDEGMGICYNVFLYNVQPGIVINYINGESWIEK